MYLRMTYIRNNYTETLENELITDDRVRLFCASDRLKQDNTSKWNQLFDELTTQQKTNQDLNLIYVDFSYCSFELEDMMILPSNKQKNDTNKCKQEPPQQRTKEPTTAPSTPPLEDEVINILLLGESGVGKSTFINAFVNYLTFKTLKEAQNGKPVVIIPVSFLLTVGKNFDEHTVKFGEFDEFNNEDFDHPGQSVTQHCKSMYSRSIV